MTVPISATAIAKRIDDRLVINLELASHIANVREAAMLRYVKGEGDVPMPPRRSDGWFDAFDFGSWLMKHHTRRRGAGRGVNYPFSPAGWTAPERPGAGDGIETVSGDKNEVEIRLKTAQAVKIETEQAVIDGRLIEVEKIEAAWVTLLQRVRTKMLRIPSSTAMILATNTDPFAVQTILEDAVRTVLEELSDDWRDAPSSDDDEVPSP